MRKILLTASVLLIVNTHSFATPPQELKLSYNHAQKILQVEITHTSNNLENHYIRKITILQNNQQPREEYFKQQPHPYKFTREFSLEAKAGDMIQVKVYCGNGGIKEAELVIPEEPQEGDGSSMEPKQGSKNEIKGPSLKYP